MRAAACVRASLAMDSCRPPLGTRLTTSALLLEAFFLFSFLMWRSVFCAKSLPVLVHSPIPVKFGNHVF